MGRSSLAFTHLLALLLAPLAACDHGPRVGDTCSMSLSGGCASDHSELVCEDGHYIEVPCRGPAGCWVDESRKTILASVVCDVSGNLDGDRCQRSSALGSGSGIVLIRAAGMENEGACTPDHKMLVACHDGTFHRQRCDGPTGCSVDDTHLDCDTLGAAPPLP